jgi:hypothetical protein
MSRSKRICRIPGCERTVEGYDLCYPHNRKRKLYGDPLHVEQVQIHGKPLRERISAYIDTRGECWMWTGCRDRNGYARVSVNNRQRLAHRIMWVIEHGEIPEGQQVLHKCDTPGCVRPDHLFLGDYQANTDDKLQKGRHRYGVSQGEAHGMAKLTETDVREILASPLSGRQLADMKGVTPTTIYDIRKRRIWKHLDKD